MSGWCEISLVPSRYSAVQPHAGAEQQANSLTLLILVPIVLRHDHSSIMAVVAKTSADNRCHLELTSHASKPSISQGCREDSVIATYSDALLPAGCVGSKVGVPYSSNAHLLRRSSVHAYPQAGCGGHCRRHFKDWSSYLDRRFFLLR